MHAFVCFKTHYWLWYTCEHRSTSCWLRHSSCRTRMSSLRPLLVGHVTWLITRERECVCTINGLIIPCHRNWSLAHIPRIHGCLPSPWGRVHLPWWIVEGHPVCRSKYSLSPACMHACYLLCVLSKCTFHVFHSLFQNSLSTHVSWFFCSMLTAHRHALCAFSYQGTRRFLFVKWAAWKNWFRPQPIDDVKYVHSCHLSA